MKRCSQCNCEPPPAARFCPQCGAELARVLSGDRRQATMLFADICGYTAMCAACDAEVVREAVRAFLDAADAVVQEHGGHVLDHAGDAIASVFGAPRAHDDDPLRALRAALALRDRAAGIRDPRGGSLQVHIGIASGEVVAGGDPVRLGKYSVTGEPANLAARLGASAPAGEILVSGRTKLGVESAFELARAGAVALKGYDLPVEAWRVVGSCEPTVDQVPFAGRAEELAAIAHLVSSAARDGCAGLAVIRGMAGSGKSRVATEAARAAAAAGSRVYWVRFEEVPDRHPWAPLISGLLHGHAGAGVLRAHEVALLQAQAGNPASSGTPVQGADLALRARETARLILQLLAAPGVAAPVLVVVEDAHFATPEDLRVIRALAQESRSQPLVMLGTVRAQAADGLCPFEGCASLALVLQPLRHDECEALARAWAAAESARVAECIARSEGHPLFLEQLLKAAFLDARAELPATLQAAVQARVDRLDAPAREALQASAVLGCSFVREEAEALLGCAVDWAVLLRADLLRDGGEGVAAFPHALVHEAVYASVLRTRCRRWHEEAAGLLRSRSLPLAAHHLDRAGSASAAPACLDAAEAEANAGHTETALRLAQRGEQLSSDPTLLARLRLVRAEAHRVTGNVQAALDALDEAEAAAGPGDEGLRARIENLRGNHSYGLDAAACERHHRVALALARQAQDQVEQVKAISGMADAAYLAGHMQKAAGYFEETVAIARRHGLASLEIPAIAMLGRINFYLGRADVARRQIDEALLRAEQSGSARAQFVAQTMWCNLHGWGHTGCDEQVISRAPDFVLRARSAGAARFAIWIGVSLARAQFGMGQVGQARAWLRELETLATEAQGVFVIGTYLSIRALTAETAAERSAFIDQTCALAERSGAAISIFFCRDAMDAALECGDRERAQRLLALMAAQSSAERFAWAEITQRRALAILAALDAARDASVQCELRAVRAEALRAGFASLLPLLERHIV